MAKKGKMIFFLFLEIIILVATIVSYLSTRLSGEQAIILLMVIQIIIAVIAAWQFPELSERTEKIINSIIGYIKPKPEPPKLVETEGRKEHVAMAVSAIIFHKTSNTPKILFCYSERQKRYILPGGHFYKKIEGTNEEIPAWYVDPNINLVDFLLEEKLKGKYRIHAHLDENFHYGRQTISGMATIEPNVYLTLSERPLVGEGHDWHHDFYYMCKVDFPDDSNIEDSCKWCSLQDVQQMVENRQTFANLLYVAARAINDKEKRRG